MAVVYKGKSLGCGYRLDILVEDTIIVEVKSVKQATDVHKKQRLSYLRLSGRPLGLVINFNVVLLQQGITRLANNLTGDQAATGVVRGARPRSNHLAMSDADGRLEEGPEGA